MQERGRGCGRAQAGPGKGAVAGGLTARHALPGAAALIATFAGVVGAGIVAVGHLFNAVT